MLDALRLAKALERAGLSREGADEFALELRNQVDGKGTKRDRADTAAELLYRKIVAAIIIGTVANFLFVCLYVESRFDAVNSRLAVAEAKLGAIAAKLDAR